MGVIKRYNPEIGPGFKTVVTGQGTVGQLGVSASYDLLVSLTAAQIIAMGTTPITIIPAPGTGKAILVDQILAEITRTSTQFTGGGVIEFFYHGQTTEIMAAEIAAASVTGTAGTSIFQLNPVSTAGGSVVTSAVGIDITNATAAFAAGTGTAKLFLRYRVVSL